MALELSLEVGSTGVCATYWRITHVQLDRDAGLVEATLHGYRDCEARRDGKEALRRLGFRLDLSALRDPSTLAMEDLYCAVRQQSAGENEPPIFALAADI